MDDCKGSIVCFFMKSFCDRAQSMPGIQFHSGPSARSILFATVMAFDEYPDARGLRYPVALVYSLVVAILWIPALILRRLGRFFREMGTDNWPRANGTITAGSVKVIHGWVVDYALGQLDYSYSVAGDYYAGSITRQYPDEQAAWDYVDARTGITVVVRYKDDNVEACVLRDPDQDRSWTAENPPGLFAMIWQHWRDELRGETQASPEDEDLQEDEDDANVDRIDPVKH